MLLHRNHEKATHLWVFEFMVPADAVHKKKPLPLQNSDINEKTQDSSRTILL